MGTVHKHHPNSRPGYKQEEGAEKNVVTVATIDEIIDQIDEILEENSLEVVRRFIQKGGE